MSFLNAESYIYNSIKKNLEIGNKKKINFFLKKVRLRPSGVTNNGKIIEIMPNIVAQCPFVICVFGSKNQISLTVIN